jgi:cytochrome d ubiquinol oxidase subunit II
MSLEVDQIIWFVLLGVLFTGYAILDGFDLGVGMLHVFVKDDTERRLLINSIGPIWDGNEVWLVTGGGAMFAAFPYVYATLFSGFYLIFMALLAALIFRAVSIEFRSKLASTHWRSMWDWAFAISSLLATLLLGAFVGNLAIGLPLNAKGEYIGGLLHLISPYPLLVGITTVALFTMHGSIYLSLRTEGELQNRVKGWVHHTITFFIITGVTTALVTLVYYPRLTSAFRHNPGFFAFPILLMLSVADVPREIARKKYHRAFIASCLSIVFLLVVLSIGLFPNLVYAPNNPDWSLSIFNSSSTLKTLNIMLVAAVIGIPIVLTYTVYIYWVFRDKVRLGSHSY